MSVVLILGSGPNVVTARDWPRAAFDHILAINNAHGVRPDWDSLIHPEDFPQSALPQQVLATQGIVTASDYVSVQNRFGGFVYAGGTMAFTAGYWALARHAPKVIAYMGCDMTYRGARTHFYGKGAADPLRDDITLRSLEAKARRLQVFAAERGCALVNLSQEDSRLPYPRSDLAGLRAQVPQRMDRSAVEAARALEAELGYLVPSGRYWEEAERFSEPALARLDALWRATPLAPVTASGDTSRTA